MHAEGADRKAIAAQLLQAVLDYPSPLSTPLFDEAAAEFTEATVTSRIPDIKLLRAGLIHQERLRAALRECRTEVIEGAAWIETSRHERWHLTYHAANATVLALTAEDLTKIATRTGFGSEGVPSLPSGWMFHAELDGKNIQELTHSTGGLMASRTRGPLTVLVTAFPAEAFAALDSQLTRQRWLIGGATAFIAASASALLLILARQRRLNAMMSNFVAAVSHEFRAPVGSMGLLAERLTDGRAGNNGER
jgi:signal transduction histidine kinase